MNSFDLRESILSFSLLQITNQFGKIKPGEEIEVTGREQKFIKDIKRVLTDYNYEIIVNEITDCMGKAFRVKLIKMKTKKEGIMPDLHNSHFTK